MRITTKGPGPHPEIATNGTELSVGSLTLDAAERQGDRAQVIDIRCDGEGQLSEGGGGRNVASIHIPPMRHEEVETGETGEDGEPEIERRAIELNGQDVRVTLWTYNA